MNDYLIIGFNLSLIITIIITLFFAFNLLSNARSFDALLIFSLLLAIIFLGLLLTTHSTVNLIINYNHASSLESFIKKESDNNLILYRITAILLFFKLLHYLLYHIFNKRLVFHNLIPRLIKNDISLSNFIRIKDNQYTTVYFGQIGIYIISFSVLCVFLFDNIHSIWINLSNFLIFYIIDDWEIIYNYSFKFNKILRSDRNKIEWFNFLLLISLSVNLFYYRLYLYASIYIIIFFLLLLIKRSKFYDLHGID